MTSILRALPRALLLALLAATSTIAFASSAQAAPQPKITFSGPTFSAATVDVAGGGASVNLTWSVADPNPAATSLSGAVMVQQFNGDDPVGPARAVDFGFPAQFPAALPDPGSTIASSHFTYQFAVGAFAASTSPVWRVTKIAATDNVGTTRHNGGDLANLQVTGAQIDSTAPEVVLFGRSVGQENIMFDSGAGVTLHFDVLIDDLETGFWKGRLVLNGPQGARVTTPIQITPGSNGFSQCGRTDVFDLNDVFCDVDVVIPAGSPSGAWTPGALVLVNNVGVSQRYTNLAADPIAVTRNDTLSASDFALTPRQANNWRTNATITLTLRPAGVNQGLSTVVLRTGSCSPQTQTPPIAADGTVSIPITFFDFADSCTIDGIALTDNAGHVAAYGEFYGAPPLGLTTTRVPDTTGPVALTAVVSPRTKTLGDFSNSVNIDVTVENDVLAPVNGFSATFYDADGVSVGGGDGGISATQQDGVIHLLCSVRMVPGTYTAGFTLYDRAGNFSQYGYPNQPNKPAPSGPLVLTIVAG